MSVTRDKKISHFWSLLFLSWLLVLAFRVVELCTVINRYGTHDGLWLSELLGLGYDFLLVNAVFAVVLPFYSLLRQHLPRLANVLMMVLIFFFSVAHYAILQYFFSQYKPLGAFLFDYSREEVSLTVNSLGLPWLAICICVLLFAIFLIVLFAVLPSVRSIAKKRILFILLYVSLPIFVFVNVRYFVRMDKFAVNKSVYFYVDAANYESQAKTYCDHMSDREIKRYHQLFPMHDYIKGDYPLLHHFDCADSLGTYFDPFDGKPNIVMLVVEGLNDDFVHDYMDVNLMPNLRELMSRSLYWRHCFTLGERSFSVMPTMLGSLPYGKIGFTLLNRLPTHVTLTSVLDANGYQTDFFYGQGAWFHRKDIFFRINDIDLVFDNKCYSDKYDKIIVGDDDYFWGYDDRALLLQSLEVIDTLPSSPRFDVYFTGSMHSPFIISNDAYYDNYLDSLVEKLNKNDKDYFNRFRTYFKTILFFDDALKEFIDEYSKRDDYENTIFVLTGDHSMSEITPRNPVKRYHVPMIIFSEKLRQPAVFDNTVSHLDFYETILPFLAKYDVKLPRYSSAFGNNLFEESNNMAFMNEERDVIDFYSDGYYLGEGVLYKLNDDFSIVAVDDNDRLEEMSDNLEIVRKMSEYTSLHNYVVPDSVYCESVQKDLLYGEPHGEERLFTGKFFNIIEGVYVEGYDELFYNVTFDVVGDLKDCIMIMQVIDKNNEKVFHKVEGVTDKEDGYQHHAVVKLPHNAPSGISFKAYLYKDSDKDLIIKDLNVVLSGRKNVAQSE